MYVENVDSDSSTEIITVGFVNNGVIDRGQLRIWNYTQPVLNLEKSFEWNDSASTRDGDISDNLKTADLNGDGVTEIIYGGRVRTSADNVKGFVRVYTSVPESENPKSCGIMNENDTCQLAWTVNATGPIDSVWYVDVNFTSENSLVNSNDTYNSQITIKNPCSVDFNMTYTLQAGVTFEEQDPGMTDIPAAGNGNYNITDKSTSGCGAVNVSIRATGDLVNGTSTIGIGNVTVNSTSPGSQTIQLSTDYQLIRANVPAGTYNVTNLYFWLNIPQGQEPRTYSTTIYIREEKA